MYVSIAPMGAAAANINKCFLILGLSKPSWSKKETKPNAAGAWNIKHNTSFFSIELAHSERGCNKQSDVSSFLLGSN